MAGKGTKIEIQRRVLEVYRMLLLGTSRAEILQYVTDTPKPGAPNPTHRPWEVEERQVDHYIARANKLFEQEAQSERTAEFGKARERLNYLYKSALGDKDVKTALAVQKEINALYGLNAPQKLKVEVTWQDEAVNLIRAGELDYSTALETFDHDEHLVKSLFAKAQVSVSVSKPE